MIARWPKMKASLYSGRSQACLISATVDAGAHAWVAKTSSPMRVIDAVRVLRSGGRIGLDYLLDQATRSIGVGDFADAGSDCLPSARPSLRKRELLA